MSSYAIVIDDGDARLLIHGLTGVVRRVSRELWDAAQDAGTLPGTTAVLAADGFLTDATAEHERAAAASRAKELRADDRRRPTFSLVLTYDCQLRCPYCYERTLQGRDPEWVGTRMNRETVALAFAAMERIAPAVEDWDLVELYGGEPLARANMEIVRLIVHEAHRRGARLFAITNGLDLDAYLPLLGPGRGIERLQVTLDGPAEVHDRRRPLQGGAGSFGRIADNIGSALQTGVHVSLRVNLSRSNVAYLPALAKVVVQRGWAAQPNFDAYAQTVNVLGGHELFREQLLIDLDAQGDQDAIAMVTTVGSRLAAFVGMEEPGTRLWSGFCGADRGSMFFLDPFGSIYACQDEVGHPASRIGTFMPSFDLDTRQARGWKGRSVASIPDCGGCAYALLCGGGCGYRARAAAGSLAAPMCGGFQDQVRQLAPRVFASLPMLD